MGSRGPIPKHSTQRRRTNSPEPTVTTVTTRPIAPDGDPDWHPVARDWFDSLDSSGESQWYEPSDWATAVLIAESMSRDLGPQVVGVTDSGEVVKDIIPLKGASLSAYLRAFQVLLVTEGDRRRAQMELERAQTVDPDAERAEATVTDLRSRLG